MVQRLSGLQKEVLSLYRSILREAVKKDRQQLDNASSFCHLLIDKNATSHYARDEFKRQVQTVPRSDFKTIEYKIRKGKKYVKMLQMPGVRVVGGA